MKTVFVDESGYTGADLLNPDQPFQALSAISITELEAESIIRKYFPGLKSSESKYGALVRRRSNWDRLLDFQRDILLNYECITYICDKKFVLILQFLDDAVEPFYYDRGVDFYKDGSNYLLASLLYYCGDHILGRDKFSDILKSYQAVVKLKSKDSFCSFMKSIQSSNWQNLIECFRPLALGCPSCINAILSEGGSTDATLIAVTSIICRLEAVLAAEYAIKHDRSKNLEKFDKYISQLISHKAPVSFRTTKINRLSFPLKLKSVVQLDSKCSFGVQVADIMVGGIVDSSKAITKVKANDYNLKIAGLYKDFQLIHLLPSLNVEEDVRFREGTEGGALIDYFAKHFG